MTRYAYLPNPLGGLDRVHYSTKRPPYVPRDKVRMRRDEGRPRWGYVPRWWYYR